MKPILLEMSAFGSYAENIRIDFENAGTGLFLITGDTGAGKTTIYDAICYALYDRTSGKVREGNMMRSQYAQDETLTYVKYIFEYFGKRYEIIRNPEYERVSKRKSADGTYNKTKEVSRVTLVMPDNKEFIGKKAEINKKIIEIIGLDYNQFLQVAMIAQGDFIKLLHANSSDRKKIFSKIFNTALYWKIEEELNSRYKTVCQMLEDNKKECRIVLSNVICNSDSEYFEEFKEQINSNENNFDRIDRLLNNIITDMKAKEKEIKAAVANQQSLLEDINAKINLANQINDMFRELEAAEQVMLLLQSERADIDSKIVIKNLALKAQAVEPFYSKYIEAVDKAEKSRARADSLKEWLEVNTDKVKISKEAYNEWQKVKEKESPLIQKDIIRIEDAIGKISCTAFDKLNNEAVEPVLQNNNISLDFIELQTQENELKQKKASIEHLEKEIKNSQVLRINADNGYERVKKLTSRYYDSLNEYEHYNEIFIMQQAGIMAEKLKEGQPCPVCGSLTHPSKAGLSDEAITQEEVNIAKNAKEQAERDRDIANAEFVKLKSEYESSKNYIVHQIKELFNYPKTEYEQALELVTVEYEECLKAIKNTEHIIADMKNKAYLYGSSLMIRQRYINERVEKLLNEYQSLSKELEINSGAFRNESDNYNVLLKERHNAENAYKNALSNNEFEQEDQYIKSRLSKQELEDIDNEIIKYSQKLAATAEKIAVLKKAINGKEKLETKELLSQHNKILNNKNEYEKEYRIIFSDIKQNKEAYIRLGSLKEKSFALQGKYNTISTLSKTANGSLSGAAKLDFETFVLRQYFRQVIAAANKRLVRIVSGQFKLVCRDIEELGGQGESGLDLDVYSTITNSVRDIKTLSGGESFMAALSMALGLADVIQKSAGSVHIDTMFIDEGFGSLDDESREQAINVLNELAGNNRLVGIISHVTELKEQIDKKLIVTKSERGSKVKWVM